MGEVVAELVEGIMVRKVSEIQCSIIKGDVVACDVSYL